MPRRTYRPGTEIVRGYSGTWLVYTWTHWIGIGPWEHGYMTPEQGYPQRRLTAVTWFKWRARYLAWRWLRKEHNRKQPADNPFLKGRHLP